MIRYYEYGGYKADTPKELLEILVKACPGSRPESFKTSKAYRVTKEPIDL